MRRFGITKLLATFVASAVAVSCGDDGTGPDGNGGEAPAAPTAVSLSAITPLTIEVTWTAASGATGQTVTLAAGGTDVGEEAVDGTATSAEFRGLQAGMEYEATVTASNANGTSPAATETFTLPATPALNNMLTDPGFADEAFSIGTRGSPPDFTPAAMPAGYTPFDVSTISDGVVEGALSLEATDYAGAIEPGTSLADAWYNGWTVWTVGGGDSRDGLSGAKPQVVVTDDIMADAAWTSGNVYVLDGIVFVGDDCGQDGGWDDLGNCGGTAVTLTIEPGTTIVGRLSADISTGERASELVISRGSRIIADATGGDGQPPTEAETIVFTSANDPGSRARGDWGGLVINGQAPINSGDEAQGEGDSGLFGGSDAMDDSGILRGVRVEYAGDNFTEDDQLNGIAPQGVGAGTTMEYIQVHYNQDDGIEPFGGTVGMKYVVLTGIGDDSFDGTDGWQGFAQYGIAQQRADDADQGFELSNNGETPDASPKTSAVVTNFTMIGSGVDLGSGEIFSEGDESDAGILMREGSYWRIYNSIVVGFGATGLDIEGSVAAENADSRLGGDTSPTSSLDVQSTILWANADAADGDANFADESGDGYGQGENKWFFLSGN